MRWLHWRIIPFLLFILLAVFLWRGLSLDPRSLPSAQVGKHLPRIDLPILVKKNSGDYSLANHVLLLNVWASWCSACVDEQLFLMQLAHQGFLIYGLNYKDKAQDAKQWLTSFGNPYQVVFQDNDGHVAIDLGVYGAPETFLVDKKGIIRYRHAGILSASIWKKEFLPRIKDLEQTS